MRHIIERLKDLFVRRDELKAQAIWVYRQGKSFMPRLLLIFLLSTLTSAVTVGCTLLNRRLIDGAVKQAGGFDAACFALLAALTIGNMLLSIGTGCIESMAQERLRHRVRHECFERFLRSPWPGASAFHSADVMTRFTSDMNTVTGGFSSLIPGFLGTFVRMVMAFFVLYRFDRMIAFAALIVGPASFIVGISFNGRLRKYQIALMENEASYRGLMQESIEGLQVVKAFEEEADAVRRYDGLANEHIRLSKKRMRVSFAMRASMSILFRCGYLLAVGWGLFRVSTGQISYGTMSLFISLVSMVSGPIFSMGEMIPQIVGMLTSAGRIMELEKGMSESKTEIDLDRSRVGVCFEHVSFAYEDAPVLSDLSFDVRPGETVGIVGETGAGKTTVVKLLLALNKAQSGTVEFFDGGGRRAEASPSTRALISYVPQGNTLRSGTLRENLQFGQDDLPEEKMWEALRVAAIDGFVRTLPDGLDARIGENGVGLSEGQAQRVAIARALLRKAPLLILDEASASLDMETERRIIENLQGRSDDNTCLIITHRPSLLRLCDRCIRIENGQAQETGDV